MHIDEIKKTKSGKYKVTIDGEDITTYDDVILKNSLLYKKDIDSKTYNQINKDNNYYDAYNKTMNYLLRKVRCNEEVKKYLDGFNLKESEKKEIIKHLTQIGLLNDRNYVRAYISDAIYLRSEGPFKIKDYLINQKISEELIDEELAKIDCSIIEEKLTKLIDKKVKLNHKYSNYQLKQKILMDMVNLGYNQDLVISILDNYQFEDSSILDKEYEKLYAKLSVKYHDHELFNKIKQKLYAKGFDINEINKFMASKENTI